MAAGFGGGAACGLPACRRRTARTPVRAKKAERSGNLYRPHAEWGPMAKSRRRRRSPNFAVIPDSTGITLGTLADATVVKGSTPPLVAQDFRHVSLDATVGVYGQTVGEGPVVIGFADNQLTVTEIKEALEAQPLNANDIPAAEYAKRKVRVMGMFSALSIDEILNEGRPKRIKMRVEVPNGKGPPCPFAYNLSGGPLTGGAIVKIVLKYYGQWK